MKTVDDFRAAAAKANAVLTIPDWEQTEAIEAAIKCDCEGQRILIGSAPQTPAR